MIYFPFPFWILSRPYDVTWKQWSLDGLDKKDTSGPREQICLPVDNWPLTTHARELLLPSVLFERPKCTSMAFLARFFRNVRSELTWKKIFLTNVIRLQLLSCAGRIGIHPYFVSMKELGHYGWFQRIYSVSCFGHGWNSDRPCVSLSSGNPNDANSPKSLRIGFKSWIITRSSRVSWL